MGATRVAEGAATVGDTVGGDRLVVVDLDEVDVGPGEEVGEGVAVEDEVGAGVDGRAAVGVARVGAGVDDDDDLGFGDTGAAPVISV